MESSLEDGGKIMLVMFLSLSVLLFSTHGLITLFHRHPLDYGEAPLVDQAMRLAAGQNIYRADLSAPPYVISNYPPLYVLCMAPWVKLFGPSFFPGRLISLLSTLATALFLARSVHLLTQDRLAAAVATLLFLAMPYVVGWSPLARVDMLALACSMAGLYAALRRPTTWRGVGVVALCLLGAVYTRQSYGLAAPLAVFVWLWTQDRRQALRLAALVGGGGAMLFLLLNGLTRGGFYFNIVTANVNEFYLETLEWYWQELQEGMPFLLLLGGIFLILAPRRVNGWPLVSPYLIGAALSAATIGKIGSNVNYLLELCAALSLATGIGLAWSRRWRWSYIIFLFLLALQVGQLMRFTLQSPVEILKSRVKPAAGLAALFKLVEETDGTVLADEFMGMATLNGRPLYIQPFEMTQLANAGLWDQTPLLESIRERKFPLILIHHFMDWPVYRERWTPEMLAAIAGHYTPVHFWAETLVYRPRDTVENEPGALDACPGAPWRLPTRADMGMWWLNKQLLFMGEGDENAIPVYAVADGLLTRRAEWNGAVAVLHDDPLQPGARVWSFYGDMAGGWDNASFVIADFPPGSEGIPVRRGQLLGFQGRRREVSGDAIWLHLHFAVLPASEDGAFPAEVVWPPADAAPPGKPAPGEPPRVLALDPAPYLGIVGGDAPGGPIWIPLRCQK